MRHLFNIGNICRTGYRRIQVGIAGSEKIAISGRLENPQDLRTYSTYDAFSDMQTPHRLNNGLVQSALSVAAKPGTSTTQ